MIDKAVMTDEELDAKFKEEFLSSNPQWSPEIRAEWDRRDALGLSTRSAIKVGAEGFSFIEGEK